MANGADTVAASWWTNAASGEISGTLDPELYGYGVHGGDFWVNLTVGPGRYQVCLKFAATRGLDTRTHCFDLGINGRRVRGGLDVAATAGSANRALDLVFEDIAPSHGVIEIRYKSGFWFLTEKRADANSWIKQVGFAF